MSTTNSIITQLNSDINLANSITGKTDTTIHSAIESLVDGYGGGDSIKLVNGMKLAYSNYIPENIDISQVIDMSRMFSYCSDLTTVPLWDTSNIANMSYMFYYCSKLTTIPLLNTSNVTNMSYMFSVCSRLITIPLLDTSKVTDMKNMFAHCSALTTIPLLDTSNVNGMNTIFSDCPKLTNESLDNILQMCINSKITSTSSKTLKNIGLSSAQATICQTLSNWQAFIDAGWKTGY